MAVPGESVSSSWDWLTDFIRSILDTIVGASCGDFTFEKIAEKLKKISRNNKAWSTIKSDTDRNRFAIQAISNQSEDYMREEMA